MDGGSGHRRRQGTGGRLSKGSLGLLVCSPRPPERKVLPLRSEEGGGYAGGWDTGDVWWPWGQQEERPCAEDFSPGVRVALRERARRAMTSGQRPCPGGAWGRHPGLRPPGEAHRWPVASRGRWGPRQVFISGIHAARAQVSCHRSCQQGVPVTHPHRLILLQEHLKHKR